MKHSYFTVLFSMLMSMVANIVVASDHDAAIDGINYKIYYVGREDLNYAVVTGTTNSGNIVIPASITHSDYYDGNYRALTVRVSSIRNSAFMNHTDITSISIPSSVGSIGTSAFSGCSGLTSIKFPGLTKISDSMFYGCSGFTSFIIPDGVKEIGYGAFQNCSGLTTIIIPNSVSSIGYAAFYGCTGLTSIIIEKETPITLTSNLVDNPLNITLYVPKGCVEQYQNANYWKNFGTIKEICASITMATASGAARSMIGYSSKYGLDFTGINDVKAYAAVAFTKGYVTYLSRVYVVPPYTGVVLRTETPGITVDIPTTDEDVYMANLLQPAVSNTTINPLSFQSG